MKYKVSKHGFIQAFGIDEIYSVQPGHFRSTTILATRGDQKVTVSDILTAAGYISNFIQIIFNTTDTKYSQALFFLKTINLVLNNQQTKKPTVECMHYAVDVFQEIMNMQATCQNELRANARIALSLNMLIDIISNSKAK